MLLLSCGVVAGACADLWVTLRPGLSAVSSEDMASAKAAIEARRRPGTVVVHSPLLSWSEVSVLGDLPARPDLPPASVRSRRSVLLLDREDAPMGGFATPAERVDLPGPLRLDVHPPTGQSEGAVPVFDLRDGLAADSAHIERPVGRLATRCGQPRAEGGFACPGQPEWLYVARRRLRIDGRDQECVWAHPTAGGALVLTVPGLSAPPPGHRLQIAVGSALTDDAVRLTPDGAAVRIQVRQGSQSIGQVRRDNRIGWAKGRFWMEPGEPVRLEVTAVRDGRRHHCLEATVYERSTEGGDGS